MIVTSHLVHMLPLPRHSASPWAQGQSSKGLWVGIHEVIRHMALPFTLHIGHLLIATREPKHTGVCYRHQEEVRWQ